MHISFAHSSKTLKILKESINESYKSNRRAGFRVIFGNQFGYRSFGSRRYDENDENDDENNDDETSSPHDEKTASYDGEKTYDDEATPDNEKDDNDRHQIELNSFYQITG